MLNCKKKISSVMVAIFTTFIVLSSTSAGAITLDTTTKVITTVATASSLLLAAQKSVNDTYFILTTSAYDLAVNQKALLKANTAVIKAINAVDLLNSNTGEFKSLRAKIGAVLTRMVNAKKNIAIVKSAEVIAVSIAEAAIKALEAAPLATATDLTAAKVLQATAVVALDKVRDSEKAITFTARLKIVANKIAAL